MEKQIPGLGQQHAFSVAAAGIDLVPLVEAKSTQPRGHILQTYKLTNLQPNNMKSATMSYWGSGVISHKYATMIY